jgi:hypothetical protein
MEREPIFVRVLQRVRENWVACLLVVIAAHLPFIISGFDGYLGRPDDKTSWFAPYEIPLMAIAVLCCLAVPFFVSGTLWHRLVIMLLAFGVLAFAILTAAFLSMAAFGIPMD